MKLTEFSVTNYRSITKAHKIALQDLTVLVGKNNEGKSNLLTALNVAMKSIMLYSKKNADQTPLVDEYEWHRDFPLQFQNRRNGLESIFKLVFQLDETEMQDFHTETGIRGNEEIPITVRVGKDGITKVEVPKRGSSSYNKKSKQVTSFVSKRISFNYIQAIRTDRMAIDTLQNVIHQQLNILKENEDYLNALSRVNELEQHVLDDMARNLVNPLSAFLPNLKDVSIKRVNYGSYYEKIFPFYREDIDVILDDGIATSISNKGDGIKSLVTLAILKEQKNKGGASVIAIEEPESHLHSGAIHGLVEVISKISHNSQVIITTHNPLFVQQNHLESNIIVDQGTARTAKNIAEIRNILGIWPSDNLKNARFVLVVEGEDDKISLSKLLSAYSEKIKDALDSNNLIIKPLNGASNLAHDLADLRNSMCKYVVLLDNDTAGQDAYEKAKKVGLLKDGDVKLTICNGMPQAEFEDCIKPSIYEKVISDEFNVSIKVKEFKHNKKWSDRMREVFLSQGTNWDEETEEKVKRIVAASIPEKIAKSKLYDVLIEQKSGFLNGLVIAIEKMLGD